MAFFEVTNIKGATGAVLDMSAGSAAPGNVLSVGAVSAGSGTNTVINPNTPATGAIYPLTMDGSGSLMVNVDEIQAGLVVGAGAQASAGPLALAQGVTLPPAVDLQGNLKVVQAYSLDMFGTPVSQYRDTQWQVNHSAGTDATNVTGSSTGSGTLSYTGVSGAALLSTTAATSSGYTLVSANQLNYQVAFEWYTYFTVGFPQAAAAVGSQTGVTGSHMRIGLYNGAPTGTDGFFVGFEGPSRFGVTQLRNGTGQGAFSANSAVGVPITAFNGDVCSGSTGAFTSGGAPVAIDFTKMNLFRMRGGWLGVGDVVLEVSAPDGAWVTMHTFRNQNVLTQPYAASTNWSYVADVQNTTNSTNVTLVLGGGSFGSSSGETRITDPLNTASVLPVIKSAVAAQGAATTSWQNLTQGATGAATAKALDINLVTLNGATASAATSGLLGVAVEAQAAGASSFQSLTYGATGAATARPLDVNIVSALGATASGLTALDVALTPQTSGGLSVAYATGVTGSVLSAKSTAGQLYGWYLGNSSGAPAYVQIYNATGAGGVTLGTTVPAMVLLVPPLGAANAATDTGIAFATGIAYACSSVGPTGTTGPSGNVIVNLMYR